MNRKTGNNICMYVYVYVYVMFNGRLWYNRNVSVIECIMYFIELSIYYFIKILRSSIIYTILNFHTFYYVRQIDQGDNKSL